MHLPAYISKRSGSIFPKKHTQTHGNKKQQHKRVKKNVEIEKERNIDRKKE
jgi:hypothetical protein